MRLSPIASIFSVWIALPGLAQSAQTPSPTQQAATPSFVVDVVVQDKSGQPIHGLKAGDFRVSENGAPQAIRMVEEHAPSAAGSPVRPPMNLPEGEFTNITGVPPGETLNVLLLDALNTPTKDQAFLRQQLLKYVQSAPPGTHLAIFGLSTHLTMLQSFTSDPVLLKNAAGHKLIPRASALQDDPAGKSPVAQSIGNTEPDAADSPAKAAASAIIAANLAAFEAQNTSLDGALRPQYTLDALSTLGHYLAGFQGRKNLIWFSSSFPVDLLPAATSKDDALRQTSALLSRAQVAVYPVDARGLMTSPVPAGAPNSSTDERAAMNALATDTGGRAILRPSSLADAVRQAMEAGASYYTLAYTPTNTKQDGSLRALDIGVNGNPSATLTYRKGYLTEKPVPPVPPPASAPKEPSTATGTSTAAEKPATPALTPEQETARHTMAAYANAAMARGGPEPQDILFKVRVLPASKTTEPAIAQGNEFGSYKLPGPYQRFDLDFVALPTALAYRKQADGGRRGAVEFIAYVYTTDGRLINTMDRTAGLVIPADKIAEFAKQPLQFHMEVSSPAKTETYLRIGIRDMLTNRFGVVEIPTSALSTLSPPVYPEGALPPAAAPAKPSTTPGTAPTAARH
jgi:VWFA-related protein